MRLWSLGQQRCITTYRIHGEGVWALCANENFTGFYSSGRDKNVMWTDLNMDDSSTLLFVEDAPVLNVSQLIKPGADLGGGCRGCAPPPPEMTCGFLIQLVFCKKKKLCGLLVLK